MLFMSLLYYYHKMNTSFDIIVLVSFTMFKTYNITSCDILCDHGHIPLHYPKQKQKQK